MQRLLAVLVALLFYTAGQPAYGQIVWQHTFLDPSGQGFNSNTVAGTTTLGALRRASAMAATDYLGTILDGRGTVRLQWDASSNDSTSGTLASFGPGGIFVISNSFQGGSVYQRGRSNASPTSNPFDGRGDVNFGNNFHYDVAGTNTTLSSETFDLVSILAHEVSHGLGFISRSTPTGASPGGGTVYSSFDRHLQQGNTANSGAMFNTNIANSSFGTFNTSVGAGAYTGGNTQNIFGTSFTNDTTNGLYFGGTFANEVFGGPVPLYSPTTFKDGSSTSHVNVGPGASYGSGAIGLMNHQIGENTTRRMQPYEIAMLMDMGWNVYNWDNTSGNWEDGVSNLSQSRWRTDRGIVLAADFSTFYNIHSTPIQAPILPVYGQTTANIVLNFGGSGSTGYDATNNIGASDTVRLARLNLNSTSTASNMISGGTLIFGLNSDGSASILAPKIVQQNSGAFVISSNIQTHNIATQVVSGVTFTGHTGLTVDGSGSGQVTLSGQISGNGTLTKAGNFTLQISGNSNTYSGITTVNAGTLRVTNSSGSATGSGNVVLNNAAVLNGTGIISGTVTANQTSNIAPGDVSTPGILTVGGLAMSSSSTLSINLNGTTAGSLHDRLVVNGTINLSGATLSLMLGGGYSPQTTDKLFIVVNDGSDAITGTFNGLSNGASFSLGAFTAFIYYSANFEVGQALTGGNDVVIAFAPVPEPSAILALGMFAVAGARVLRRRSCQNSAADTSALAV